MRLAVDEIPTEEVDIDSGDLDRLTSDKWIRKRVLRGGARQIKEDF